MSIKGAFKEVLEAMPTGADIKEQVVKEVGDAKGFLGKMAGDVIQELKDQVKHGSHEVASALFNGDAFVMYPHEGKQPDHGLPPEAGKEQEQQKEQERGGLEM